MRTLKRSAAALAVCLLLAGCSGAGDDEEYHVFSDGVMISSEEIVPAETKKADFYVPEGMETDYYRGTLSNEELRVYYDTVDSLGKMKATVPLPIDSTSYYKILNVIRREQLSYSHILKWELGFNGETQQFEVTYTYRFTADEMSSMNMASEKAAKEIIAQLTPDMDDYEKLKFFHDYLISSCETDTDDPYADTIYGTLVRKKALCEGYAKSFSYLCSLAGIENVLVTGSTGVAHMWNMVRLNGSWYHVDVTWDKPDDELHKNYPGVILYQYFMVTDSVIKNNHEISLTPLEPPKAYGTEENYFVREGADVTSGGELLTVSENAITSAVREGKSSAMIKFSTTDLYLNAISDIDNQELFTPVTERVMAECGKNIRLSWTAYYGQYRILTFIIEYD